MTRTEEDQEMTPAAEDDVEMVQVPAILRLSPELLALIFHYVYVTPVVHRPVLSKDGQQQDSGAELSSTPSTTTPTTPTSDNDDDTTTRRKKDKRKSAVYIQNDLSSMLALCLTCRAFYPQAIRLLWRQRTLTGHDDLTEFYQAIDFSASLRKRQQKQRQQEQQLQRPDMGYAVEEGLFNNEAALRIKSLTLLDMSFDSTLTLAAAAQATSVALASGQFFGSSSSHGDPLAGGAASLDLCQGIDLLTKANNTVDENSMQAGISKDAAPVASSSSSSTTPSSASSHSQIVTRRRPRQKTTSIYSEMISPRLLHTIANHCYALVDLTFCMDSKPTAAFSSSSRGFKVQPSIPFSIIAGALLSLKRLTLMGLVCNSKQNRTGAELLLFAQKTQPLESISIRSCKGISLATYIEFAVRSHRHLLSVDFQGLDFESERQLTDMMSAYAKHCKNMKSITLSCINGLPLDGMMEALACQGAPELQELHVLGHDSFRVPTQQQQKHGPIPPKAELNNNVNDNEVPVTEMCYLADANVALANLAQLSLRRLTLYCPGITDFALFSYLCHSPKLVDLILNEPTTVLHYPQFQPFVQQCLPTPEENTSEQQESTPAPFTSAGFLGLILTRCPWLKYMFMKVSLESAQEWIVQPCFKEAGLDKRLFQYRTATGAPAVVLMWDTRSKVLKA
ncbi:hypothetical protein BGZ65_001302 [Modicella reniformis]|uniref:Uncharacterized protein n=1 Tax=Modicella reniformis TaxID=1440133 RepID=A0A9P6J1Z3_9FUNG|nr:hypothetical protein BGZ65_001302 [Modicella reniformis]